MRSLHVGIHVNLVLLSLILSLCLCAGLIHKYGGRPTGITCRYRQGNGRVTCLKLALHMKPLSREDEIRRKILQLKKQGKIKESSDKGTSNPNAAYEDKVRRKLGTKKSKLLGFVDGDNDNDNVNVNVNVNDQDLEVSRIQSEIDDEIETEEEELDRQPRGRIGSLPEVSLPERIRDQPQRFNSSSPTGFSTSSSQKNNPLINPELFDQTEETPEMSEEELVELVAKKLAEKRTKKAATSIPSTNAINAINDINDINAGKETREKQEQVQGNVQGHVENMENQGKTTTGVGGTWTQEQNTTTEFYQPKSGSWGAFPRPKDISKTYGGGRRVGAGYSKEDQVVADFKTQELLRDYRRKAGIDVPTEKEHAAEIEEALQIAQRAMQRGVYATAVSALEKVTKWCSSNSKVGSKVFLELAMAYEAVGRTREAYQIYQTLTTCRMEDVKYNAKRLMYGLEAMEIMRDVSPDFSRNKVKNTFMDATGFMDMAKNFDDVYQTAYIDLDSGYYKRLTESVVRSNREARQILLKATGRGEVGRMKVVQALRSIARHFDDALEIEIESNKKVEPTVFLDGKPLLAVKASDSNTMIDLDEFVLATPEQMMKNLDGTWRLQLLADKQGDGVSFFNTSTAILQFSSGSMTFSASGPSGLTTIKASGDISMDDSKRILSKNNMQTIGGAQGFLGIFGGGKDTGFIASVSRSQQIVSVDSILLITKCAPGTRKGKDAEKEHFAVWRRVRESDSDMSG